MNKQTITARIVESLRKRLSDSLAIKAGAIGDRRKTDNKIIERRKK